VTGVRLAHAALSMRHSADEAKRIASRILAAAEACGAERGAIDLGDGSCAIVFRSSKGARRFASIERYWVRKGVLIPIQGDAPDGLLG